MQSNFKFILLIISILPLFSFGQVNDRFALEDEHFTQIDNYIIKTELTKNKVWVSIKSKEPFLMRGFYNSKVEPFKVINIAPYKADVWIKLIGEGEDDSGFLDFNNWGNMELTIVGMNNIYNVYVFTTIPTEGDSKPIVIVQSKKL